MTDHNFKQLRENILARSHSQNWDEARKEWFLADVFVGDVSMTCLCGHTPIIELCEIRNRLTKLSAIIGNICVNNFIGIDSHNIFEGVKRVMRDDERALNVASLGFFYDRNVISRWELEFGLDTSLKRKLSYKQMVIRKRINEKVLNYLGKIIKRVA